MGGSISPAWLTVFVETFSFLQRFKSNRSQFISSSSTMQTGKDTIKEKCYTLSCVTATQQCCMLLHVETCYKPQLPQPYPSNSLQMGSTNCSSSQAFLGSTDCNSSTVVQCCLNTEQGRSRETCLFSVKFLIIYTHSKAKFVKVFFSNHNKTTCWVFFLFCFIVWVVGFFK